MSNMVKAVLFDVDDTIYDHRHHIHSGIAALQEKHTFLQDYPLEYLKKLSHELLEVVHRRLLKGEISQEESRRLRWQTFLAHFGEADNFDPIEFSDSYLRTYYASERVVPGTVELLDLLRGKYSLGIISNNLLTEQLEKLKRLGISEYFDFLAISEEVGYAKPDKRIFEIALERGKVTASETVLIGDSWDSDIVGALEVGIRPIWLNRSGYLAKDPGVIMVTSLEPAEAILRHIRNESATPQITSVVPPKA